MTQKPGKEKFQKGGANSGAAVKNEAVPHGKTLTQKLKSRDLPEYARHMLAHDLN